MRKFFYYSFLIFTLSIIIGYYYSTLWKKSNFDVSKEENENNIQETSSSEEKISYNADFALKKYYSCGHLEITYAELPKEMINLNKKEVEEQYPLWNVEEFKKDSIVLSQYVDNMCNDHYIIKKNDDSISIYKQKKDDIEFYRETNISIDYLTEEDKEKLENGILVYGKNNLNSVLEDFE